MHVAFGQFSPDIEAHPDFAGAESAALAPSAHRSVYGQGRRFSPGSIAVVTAVHAALFAALVTLDVVPVGKAKTAPIVVEMLALPQEPPPSAPPPPMAQEVPEPLAPIRTPVVAPPPIVRTISAPPPVAVAPQAMPTPPAPAAKAAAPSPAPAEAGPVKAGDLSSRMIAFDPPRYPFESRKKKEQGTVLLSVLLDVTGRVEDLSVAKSSGHKRLDKAALHAVRKWRWSPTVRHGTPVMVRGSVQIPFVLTS